MILYLYSSGISQPSLIRLIRLIGLAKDFLGIATVASVLLLFLLMTLVGVLGNEANAIKLDWVTLNLLVAKYWETSPWFDPICLHGIMNGERHKEDNIEEFQLS